MASPKPNGASAPVGSADIDEQLASNAAKLRKTVEQQPTADPQSPVGKQWWRADEAMTISAAVLLFGVLVMLLMTVVLRRSGIHPDAVLRLFGTTIVVIGALFLIVAGYTETQMGPVMGLLGTIAGYLLGKNVGQRSEKAPHAGEA